jgi:hypothetical protein
VGEVHKVAIPVFTANDSSIGVAGTRTCFKTFFPPQDGGGFSVGVGEVIIHDSIFQKNGLIVYFFG